MQKETIRAQWFEFWEQEGRVTLFRALKFLFYPLLKEIYFMIKF